MKKYFPVFDKLRKEFLVGEMIWTFTDYSVLECKYDRQSVLMGKKEVRLFNIPL